MRLSDGEVDFRSPPDGGLPNVGSIGGGGFSGATVGVGIKGQHTIFYLGASYLFLFLLICWHLVNNVLF